MSSREKSVLSYLCDSGYFGSNTIPTEDSNLVHFSGCHVNRSTESYDCTSQSGTGELDQEVNGKQQAGRKSCSAYQMQRQREKAMGRENCQTHQRTSAD